jgi:type VI secretion system protein ImpK
MSQQPLDMDPDRTVIIPSPQGRAAPRGATVAAPPLPEAPTNPTGLNPLVAAANPLLDIVPQLRAALQHPDPVALRSALVRDIKLFESRARAAGVDPEKIVGARYALCTLLDETAASTPWGGSGVWGKQTLLTMFHNETWGGEKFFLLLSKLAQNPASNRDLLELLYICLALGFEGRYRVMDNGKAQLESVRERLAAILQKGQPEYERDLSPAWRAASVQRSRLFSIMPLWVTMAVCGVVLLGVYLTLVYLLNADSDPVFARIQAVKLKTEPPAPPPVPAPQPRLTGLLAEDIARGTVAVRDDVDRSVITILGDGLFAPGSSTIAAEFEPVLARIGNALERSPGNIRVIGHTDNRPIRSPRFPSNWHLSEERARNVAQMLTRQVRTHERITAEGRAEAEPVAPNDTPANRARNRRVEITLLVAPDKSNLK